MRKVMYEVEETFSGIDIGRIFFACAIPLLHIGGADGLIGFLQQYIARLGVPFFFAASGFFLVKSKKKYGNKKAMHKYIKKISFMLCFWLALYSPLLIYNNRSDFVGLIHHMIFQTPAYLWYLTGLIVAVIPFVLITNRRLLRFFSIVLFGIGIYFCDTYQWLTGGCAIYNDIFLTSRNGVFFGLPLMMIGELVAEQNNIRNIKPFMILTTVLLFAEISFATNHVAKGDDRTYYLMLPVFTFFLLYCMKNWNPDIDTGLCRQISVAIYVMQYGIITVGSFLLRQCVLSSWGRFLVLYLLVIIVPTILCKFGGNTKLFQMVL